MRWSRQIAIIAVAGTFAFGTTGCSEKQPTVPREGAQVSVGASGFQPPAITVTQRDSITWRWNSGGVSHNVTFENGPASATQADGQYGRQFLTAGTYRYRCTLHSGDFATGMVGTVEVRAQSGAYAR